MLLHRPIGLQGLLVLLLPFVGCAPPPPALLHRPHGAVVAVPKAVAATPVVPPTVAPRRRHVLPTGEAAYLPFANQPAWDPKAISLTFDDAPDLHGVTERILDTLAREKLHATFFANTHNGFDLETSPAGQAVLRRIVAEGHALGNHTARHRHLSKLASGDIVAELAQADRVLRQSLGVDGPSISLVRTPYGEPYAEEGDDVLRIAPIVARYGVHVGWGIDSEDWHCHDQACVVHGVLAAVDHGHWGVVLLHATHAATADALPLLVAELRRRDFHFVSVAELIYAKYGADSETLLTRARAGLPLMARVNEGF